MAASSLARGSGHNILLTRNRKEMKIHLKIALKFHWTTSVEIHLESYNPSENTTNKNKYVGRCRWSPSENATENPRRFLGCRFLVCNLLPLLSVQLFRWPDHQGNPHRRESRISAPVRPGMQAAGLQCLELQIAAASSRPANPRTSRYGAFLGVDFWFWCATFYNLVLIIWGNNKYSLEITLRV